MRANPQRFGRYCEWLALFLLMVKGYRLRHRNWSGGGGELDLVMKSGRDIVFVEVKARSGDAYGGAVGALNLAKRRNLTRAASAYLSRFDLWDSGCRFDLVTVERGNSILKWRLRHFKNAFQPNLGRQM